MVYENMRVAVAKFVGRHEKEPTVALLNLRAHYGFAHRFTNCRRGNEKGYLLRLMERELEVKLENRKKAQIRKAGFPYKMYLTELERDQLPEGAGEKLPLPERLDFMIIRNQS